MNDRDERRHPAKQKPLGARSESQTDRDRILYTSAFRRLGGVTQVVGAVEGHVFHNRLTHTLEVAQLARRLAERLQYDHANELSKSGEILDEEVAEAAALAHDLGHPPFGHVAEDELRRVLTTPAGATEPDPSMEGFEGNAQSFRILVRLAAHRSGYVGLNLTRATLNAVLKYPWPYDKAPAERGDKYGAYYSDIADFDFAREGSTGCEQSLEAQIMDHADGVAYSVHDLDDFYRVGLVPLETIGKDFYVHFESCKTANPLRKAAFDAYETKLKEWAENVFPRGRYTGAYIERTSLRYFNSVLIDEFVRQPKLEFGSGTAKLEVDELVRLKMKFLQHLVWKFVIETPRLATQQHGQRRIIRTLFTEFHSIVSGKEKKASALLPGVFTRQLAELHKESGSQFDRMALRLAADVVASFTDHQAGVVFRRLTGVAPGSVTDLVDY